MLSKTRDTLHDDPLLSGQHWYCPICKAKYKTRFGMFVEVRRLDRAVYQALADCCDWDDRDLKALILEDDDRYKDAKTPEDLYSMIPSVHPTEGEFIRKARPSDFWKSKSLPEASIMDGIYKMENVHILKELEKWDWKDMTHFFK